MHSIPFSIDIGMSLALEHFLAKATSTHFNNKIHPNSIRNIQATNRILGLKISFKLCEFYSFRIGGHQINVLSKNQQKNQKEINQKISRRMKKNTKIECEKKKSFRTVRLVCEFFDGFGRVVRYMGERKKGNKKVCRTLYKQWAASSKYSALLPVENWTWICVCTSEQRQCGGAVDLLYLRALSPFPPNGMNKETSIHRAAHLVLLLPLLLPLYMPSFAWVLICDWTTAIVIATARLCFQRYIQQIDIHTHTYIHMHTFDLSSESNETLTQTHTHARTYERTNKRTNERPNARIRLQPHTL